MVLSLTAVEFEARNHSLRQYLRDSRSLVKGSNRDRLVLALRVRQLPTFQRVRHCSGLAYAMNPIVIIQ